jgi:hypothetical protein
MGEQIGIERAVGTGPRSPASMMTAPMTGMVMPTGAQGGHTVHGGMGQPVPGYPQGMMDMPMGLPDAALKRITGKRETRGMRHDWYTGLQGLMTVVRVLPAELFEAVMSGASDVPAGTSVPGSGPAAPTPHHYQH